MSTNKNFPARCRISDREPMFALAHDNQLLGRAEGRYVFEAILSLLRFIKALDEAKFGR